MKKCLSFCICLATVLGLTSCKSEKDMPDNGVRKLRIAGVNYHYIPWEQTQFLIPDKTWLRGFSRNATDNQVEYITLHALPPKIEPWSKENHKEMYGDGLSQGVVQITISNIYLIYGIDGKREFEERKKNFHQLPYSRWSNEKIIKLPDDVEGLIKFRSDFDSKNDVRYLAIRDGKVEYTLICSSYCDLNFFQNGYEVELHFYDIYLKDAVQMADKVKILLDKFEQDGKRYGHLAQMTERGKVGVF